jgi:hypothetical protein
MSIVKYMIPSIINYIDCGMDEKYYKQHQPDDFLTDYSA